MHTTNQVKELWNARDVALRLGISTRSVWRLLATGSLPAPVRLSRQVVRWRAADIRAWIEKLPAA